MNSGEPNAFQNRRILVIDDNEAIHDDFKKILTPPIVDADQGLAEMETELFGETEPNVAFGGERFTVDSAFQGQEGLRRVEAAVAEGRPYAMAFVDVRMPPGWDGIETTERIWKVDPALQIVISTAYSDYSWDAMMARLGQSDGLVILKKPFDPVEVLQLAHAFVAKWNLNRAVQSQLQDLEQIVEKRTVDLRKEITEHKKTAVELEKARDAAEAANHAKSGFLANMSHEIRTPMNGVLGMCQLLLDSNLTPDQLDLAHTLKSSSEALLSLLNDILDFSKIEADKLTLEIVDFSPEELIEDTAQLMGVKAAEKDLEFVAAVDPGIPPRLMGDPTRLRQIVVNLLSNALKFTHQGEVALEVKLVAQEKDAARLHFAVRDTGIGIPPDVQARLFKPFSQADSSITRRFGGTGLGLAICHRLVHMMGGSIKVRSDADRGSEFSFEITLALASAPGESSATNKEDVPDLRPLMAGRLLFVSDHDSHRQALVATLESWGINCTEATTPKSAISALKTPDSGDPVRVLLIDQQFQNGRGLELVRRIRRHHSVRDLKILLLSSRHKQPAPSELSALGIYTCVFKPVRRQLLRSALLEAVQSGDRTKKMSRRKSARVSTPPGQTARILVAEDNPVNQKLALLQLKQLGYASEIVANGQAALEAVQNQTYDLVLMDCQMPELDGFEATRAIRAFETRTGAKPVPIVAMTAGAIADDRDHCLACGMDAYIAKPVRREVLNATLSRHLSPSSSIKK